MNTRIPMHPSALPSPQVSIVVPMHNEVDNLPATIDRIAAAMDGYGTSYEIVAVDDGSIDTTRIRLESMASADSRLGLVSYSANRGRGYALRRGFAASHGAIIVTIDADLSYDPKHIVGMLELLRECPDVDFVIGSPYSRGGSTLNVPRGRLWISRWGNRVLGLAMPGHLSTVTGILRAYRREVLDVLDLESNDKELHLEIVSKALAAGFVPAEMPAVLTGRRKGSSKFFLRATVASHLIFSFYEKPILLFGLIGALFLGLGVGCGFNLLHLWHTGTLNPDRPLIPLTVILLVAGLQILLFGFLGSQIVQVRRELFRTQKTMKMAMRAWNPVLPADRPDGSQRPAQVVESPGRQHPVAR
ncbi:MAG: glycosyltransferase family 2 protein [candidate division Zixibacteria bacterium]|nr:glycosyltransferase family 2 protein [candidate division Zixibacteria bacterium]